MSTDHLAEINPDFADESDTESEIKLKSPLNVPVSFTSAGNDARK